MRRAEAALEAARRASAAIEGATRELAALEDAMRECTTWGPRGGGARPAHPDPTQSMACARIGTLASRIEDGRAEKERMEDEIGAALRMIEGVRREVGEAHAEALELYYLDGASTWSEVAEEMGVHRNTARLWRDEAISWLEAHCARFLLGC